MATTSYQCSYEYINETEIDEELKCAICKQPLQSPVSLSSCNHTFCEECIDDWLVLTNTCPTCRQINSNSAEEWNTSHRLTETSAYTTINTRIVLNQLDRLLVRCLRCDRTNIQRGNYSTHQETCSKRTVTCPAVDLKCAWNGTRDELEEHLNNCPFTKLRPMIEELKGELQTTKIDLENSVRTLEDKVNFLLKLINKGNFLSQDCTMPMNECKYELMNSSNEIRPYTCSVCNEPVLREQILVHSCLGDCICYSCVNAQYFIDSDDRNQSFTDDYVDDSSVGTSNA